MRRWRDREALSHSIPLSLPGERAVQAEVRSSSKPGFREAMVSQLHMRRPVLEEAEAVRLRRMAVRAETPTPAREVQRVMAQIHPAAEEVVGPVLTAMAVAEVRSRSAEPRFHSVAVVAAALACQIRAGLALRVS